MIDHRIAKLRFLFATLYCAILVWFFPVLNFYIWLIPLGLLAPVIATAAPCSKCNPETQTDEVQLTFTGIADGTCSDCNNLNRTMIHPFLGVCSYSNATASSTHCGGAIQLISRFNWDFLGGGVFFDYFTNAFLGTEHVALWDRTLQPATPHDCDFEIPDLAVSSVSFEPGHCDWTNAKGTVTPSGNYL